jgi:hypothetical protein
MRAPSYCARDRASLCSRFHGWIGSDDAAAYGPERSERSSPRRLVFRVHKPLRPRYRAPSLQRTADARLARAAAEEVPA